MSREKVEDISLSTSSPSRVEPSKYEMKETVGLPLFATITTKKKRQKDESKSKAGTRKKMCRFARCFFCLYLSSTMLRHVLSNFNMLLTCRLPYILCVLAYLIGIGTAQFIRDMLTMRKVYRKGEEWKSEKNNKRRKKRIIKKDDKMLNVLYIDKQKEEEKI